MLFNPDEPQKRIIKHLLEHKVAALFVGMGIGKTAPCLHVIEHLICDGEIKAALIVAPKRVVNLVWPAEARKWELTHRRVVRLRGKRAWDKLQRQEGDIYVINYELLPKLQGYLKSIPRLKGGCAFDMVVWDELTRTKNHRAKRINAVRPYLRMYCKRSWGLTGTPRPNSLMDLFAQIRLLDDGQRLGRSFATFRDAFFHATDYMQYNWEPNPGAKEAIYKRIQDITLTLLARDWLDIPEMIQEDVELALCKEAEEKYRTLEKDLVVLLENDTVVTAANAAVLVNKLLQVTSGAVYDADGNWHILHDGKIKVLQKLLKAIGPKPVLIACNYRHEQERIAQAVPGIVRFDSAHSHKAQEELVEYWNTGLISRLMANPQSIGHGLNLQAGGNTIVWFSLPWSREYYDQFNARLARRGQDQITDIYRIITLDTMDEVVAEVLAKKDTEQNALLEALRDWKDELL